MTIPASTLRAVLDRLPDFKTYPYQQYRASLLDPPKIMRLDASPKEMSVIEFCFEKDHGLREWVLVVRKK